MNTVLELYGMATDSESVKWASIVELENCPFTRRRCIKTRKSQPEVTIGTCTLSHGANNAAIVVCPNRLLERRQIFIDCLHLLTLHEPGNELHVVQEVGIPGGSVDFFLLSVHHGRVMDFVAIEIQTLDTTGTVWPTRQAMLGAMQLSDANVRDARRYGINWKMTAKTILVQLNHKIHTLENLNKHLVLVIQDHLLTYMRRGFNFGHIRDAKLSHSAHFHVYALQRHQEGYRLDLTSRLSTDAEGIARSLGLQSDPNVELALLTAQLEAKITSETLLQIG